LYAGILGAIPVGLLKTIARAIIKILDNSVPNSNHLKGKAIDLLVLDIDGDGR